MTLEIVRSALLWCSIINYGMLILWSVLFLLPHEWMYRFKGRWFRISAEQFDAINFAGILFYKCCIFLFNIVPYAALWIVA